MTPKFATRLFTGEAIRLIEKFGIETPDGLVKAPESTFKKSTVTLYHFHKPKDEEEANAWIMNFLVRYKAMRHRSEPHSRVDDRLENLLPSGVRAICSISTGVLSR